MSPANLLFNNVTSLLGLLFEREEAHLKQRADALIVKNISLGGSQDGFRHMGVIYSQLQGRMRKLGNYSALNNTLLPEIASLSTDRMTMEAEKDRIKQALVMVLRGCQTFQDMRDALPNGVKDLIPECRHLARTRPEAFTLADNPRSYTQYMAIREKIEFYVATRLLY